MGRGIGDLGKDVPRSSAFSIATGSRVPIHRISTALISGMFLCYLPDGFVRHDCGDRCGKWIGGLFYRIA